MVALRNDPFLWGKRLYVLLGYVVGATPLPRIPVANQGFSGSPTEHVIILVVTVTGRGPHPIYMGVSKNRGTPKSSILIGFSLVNHPFWGTIIFGNTHMVILVLGRVFLFNTNH